MATDNGLPMSDEQVRDECMTIFLAGHETTANTLSWTLALLARHPQWLERVRQEIQAHGSEDYATLENCRWVTQEAMRLYPSAWVIGRMPSSTATRWMVSASAPGTTSSRRRGLITSSS